MLDVNVLLALLDSDHIDHRRARDWLESEIAYGWASCAVTQNGFVRVISQPRYPSPVTPSQAIGRLARAASTEHHQFWPGSVSILDETVVSPSRIYGPRQVTDAYLLALAAMHGGRFVTFDRSVPIKAAREATEANLTIL